MLMELEISRNLYMMVNFGGCLIKVCMFIILLLIGGSMLNIFAKIKIYGANLVKWFKDWPYSDCPKCNKKGVHFSHTEHFTPGEPDVYHCKFCNKYFI